MPQRRQPTEPPARPKLTVSRAEARQRIEVQVVKGRDLLARPVRSEEELETLSSDVTKWSDFNHELLQRLFDNSTMANEYYPSVAGIALGYVALEERVREERRDITWYIGRLESVLERLELIPEPATAQGIIAAPNPGAATDPRTVFIVHGHDEAAKEAVARFVMKLNLKPVILAEEPSLGKTIIEKLEASSGVGFAVVLLTPDDVGAAKAETEHLKPRARQNVVLELGYFVARLGRDRVCALYQSGVELPSDYRGVAYVELDAGGAWKLALAREIKAAGVDVDLNLAM